MVCQVFEFELWFVRLVIFAHMWHVILDPKSTPNLIHTKNISDAPAHNPKVTTESFAVMEHGHQNARGENVCTSTNPDNSHSCIADHCFRGYHGDKVNASIGWLVPSLSFGHTRLR